MLTRGIFGVLFLSCGIGAQATWQEIPALARSNHALAYDSGRGRVVMFGGRNESGRTPGETWEWDGTSWLLRTPPMSPPARIALAMAYDPLRQRTVLFGGAGANSSDTWEWDGTTWLQLSPPNRPFAREGHRMAYDSVRGRVVLCGGNSGGRALLPFDTWEWDGAVWTQRPLVQAPSPRDAFSLSADTARGRIVLYGGNTSVPFGTFSSETWEWDGTTWSLRTPAQNPGPRASHSAAFDSARNVTFLFGHLTSVDMWEWDGSNWSRRLTSAPIPSPRTLSGLAYDSGRGQTVLFGGSLGSSGRVLSDTWEWSGTAWSPRVPPASAPPLWLHAMCFDATRGETVLFGGNDAISGKQLNETWAWNGTLWRLTMPQYSPSGRFGHALAFDSGRGRAVLFGGRVGITDSTETWEWSHVAAARHARGSAEAFLPCAGL